MKYDYSKLKPRIETLDNGLKLYLFPDHNLDLVRLEFIFDAGSFFQSKPLQSGACSALIGCGTEHYSANQLSEELDFYGAYIERYSDRDQSCITFYSLSRYFTNIISFCEEAIKRSRFPQDEFDTYLRKQHSRFQVDMQKVDSRARREFYPMVFGAQHPYGCVVEEEDFARLNRAEVEAFYKNHYCAANCAIVLAGHYTKEDIKVLNLRFGQNDWLGTPVDTALPVSAATLPPVESRRRVSHEGSLQEAILTGMPVCSFQSPDFAPFKVVDYILGGYFGSRLMRNIREDKGYTYGISSYTVPLRHSPVWLISSEVKAGCAEKVLKEIHKEIRKLQRREIGRKELELVRNAYMGEFMQDLDGTFDIAERVKLYLQIGLGPEYYERMEQTLFSITPRDIKLYAQRLLEESQFRTVIVGA